MSLKESLSEADMRFISLLFE